MLHSVFLFVFRIDMHITGMDMVGGFSIACPPSVLKKTRFIELAVKYTEHPPAYWIHTQVGGQISTSY